MFTGINADDASFSHQIKNTEEAFLVRRISEFYKDKDFSTVKEQIVSFLDKYPKSTLRDHIVGLLGDLNLQEKNYEKSLAAYRQIKSKEIRKKVFLNKCQCLYELKKFKELLKNSELGLKNPELIPNERQDEFSFLAAESYYRYAFGANDKKTDTAHLQKAKNLYETLNGTPFENAAKYALCEIYKEEKSHDKAAIVFHELALNDDKQREELLFHAALCEAHYDKEKAIDTFETVIGLEGSKTTEAAFDQLLLFYETDNYQEVISHAEKVCSLVSDDKNEQVRYLLARSYYAEGEFEKTFETAASIDEESHNNPVELRNLLLMKMKCAQELKKEAFYKETLDKMRTLFPKDKELAKTEFIYSILLKELGELEKAKHTAEEVLVTYPEFEDKQSLLLHYISVTYENKDWQQTYSTLRDFIATYPEHPEKKVVKKYLLSTAFELYKEIETDENSSYSKVKFLDDLNIILQETDLLSAEEYEQSLFLQAQLQYELEQYDEAATNFSAFIEENSNSSRIHEAHFLLSLCQFKTDNTSESFISHAEKAMSNEELRNTPSARIQLYNTFLSYYNTLSEDHENKEAIIETAAHHLYHAFCLDPQAIKVANLCWLATHYYQKLTPSALIHENDVSSIKENEDEHYNKAMAIYSFIFPSEKPLLFTKDNLYQEGEILKYADLLQRKQAFNEKRSLLERLIECQSKQQWTWLFKEEALLTLAKSYETLSEYDNAHELYQFLAEQHPEKRTFLKEYASLQTISIQFDQLSQEEKTLENPKIKQMLNTLKEYSIQKTCDSEPIHFEASLEYARIRGQLSQSTEDYLFYLKRIQEDYSNKQDPLVVNYFEQIENDSNKKTLYELYNQFLMAEIYSTESKLFNEQGDLEQAKSSLEKQRESLEALKINLHQSFYISKRIHHTR